MEGAEEASGGEGDLGEQEGEEEEGEQTEGDIQGATVSKRVPNFLELVVSIVGGSIMPKIWQNPPPGVGSPKKEKLKVSS